MGKLKLVQNHKKYRQIVKKRHHPASQKKLVYGEKFFGFSNDSWNNIKSDTLLKILAVSRIRLFKIFLVMILNVIW